MEYKLPPLPTPDVCVRNDFTGEDVYSHSAEKMQAYAIAAIEAQASVVQQEPVGVIVPTRWETETGKTTRLDVALRPNAQLSAGQFVYTHPAQQAKPQPLTHDQKWEMWTAATIELPSGRGCYFRGVEDAEAAHGIKGS